MPNNPLESLRKAYLLEAQDSHLEDSHLEDQLKLKQQKEEEEEELKYAHLLLKKSLKKSSYPSLLDLQQQNALPQTLPPTVSKAKSTSLASLKKLPFPVKYSPSPRTSSTSLLGELKPKEFATNKLSSPTHDSSSSSSLPSNDPLEFTQLPPPPLPLSSEETNSKRLPLKSASTSGNKKAHSKQDKLLDASKITEDQPQEIPPLNPLSHGNSKKKDKHHQHPIHVKEKPTTPANGPSLSEEKNESASMEHLTLGIFFLGYIRSA
jgi:hypothetical protein